MTNIHIRKTPEKAEFVILKILLVIFDDIMGEVMFAISRVSVGVSLNSSQWHSRKSCQFHSCRHDIGQQKANTNTRFQNGRSAIIAALTGVLHAKNSN